jgi:hypothetical protein
MGTLSEELAVAVACGGAAAKQIAIVREFLTSTLQSATLQRTERNEQHTAGASSARRVADLSVLS